MSKTEKNANDKKTCFIVTPIGEHNSKIRRHIDGVIDASIIPALGEDYIAIIPHRLYDSTAITKQIYKDLNESDLVIANLTELNPNVMYELAIRFCIGKPVIIIAEEGTKLPFDVKDQRTFFYINDSQGTLDLRKKISQALSKIDFSDEPSSPIYDALGEIALFKQLKNEEDSNGGVSDKAISLIMDKLDDMDSKIRSVNRFYDNENNRINIIYSKPSNEFSYDATNLPTMNILKEALKNYNNADLTDKSNNSNDE